MLSLVACVLRTPETVHRLGPELAVLQGEGELTGQKVTEKWQGRRTQKVRSCALRLKQAQSSARRKRVVAVVWGRETLRVQRFQASHPQGCDAHRAGQSFVTELSSRLWSSRPDLYSPDASTTLPSNTSKKCLQVLSNVP